MLRRRPDGEVAPLWNALERNKADDAAFFAVLERLERRMAAAMAKPARVRRGSGGARNAPPGTRRIATGVVINQSAVRYFRFASTSRRAHRFRRGRRACP